ncbi:MAG: alpha/beta family hydrolase [Acidobacteriota bacterium]|nr:alpha/beta family hydrolase [Acidobacteriota bacterium]|tara:strand:+ start:525 stop:1124 length:600 start_codon:yes stop_codon:yes gene_type:complete
MLHNGPADSDTTLILAHGAGAGMDSPVMEAFAAGLASNGVRVIRFEFPYMQQRRRTGKFRGPDRLPVLMESWRNVVALAGSRRLIIGGKSMGGRIASMLADDVGAHGLICLGYPFHPVGKPENLRTAHLAELKIPTLIVQGTRDPFGRPDEVSTYQLSPAIKILWLEDGDHSFKPTKASGRTLEQNIAEAIVAIREFIL